MDPVCHTLVGASLGATGLSRKTRLGCTTLILAANVPDIDAALYFFDDARAYAFRRGLTHGFPAVALLAVLLALAVAALSRALPARLAGKDTSLRWLVILSLIGAATHPLLDWLNNYGIRWLMPIADTWYYGDTLFIVDPGIWLVLALGLLAARRRGFRNARWYRRPASIALALVVVYIGASRVVTQLAEHVVRERTADDAPQRIMASPVPLRPFDRAVVLDYDTDYRFGRFRLLPSPRFEWEPVTVTKSEPQLLERIARTRDGGWFLRWARFPYAVVEGTRARVADARYVRDIDAPRLRRFGEISIELDDAPADR